MWKWVLLSFFLAGCATTYKELRPDQIKSGQGVAVGKITVLYNDQPYTGNCAVCLNSVNGPCQKLEDNGIVFIPVQAGEGSVRRVVCKDVSPQHYNIEGATFTVQKDVTYFGDITLQWHNKGGFKPALIFGLFGALADESSNDGQLQMSVTNSKSSRDQLLGIYRRQMALQAVETHSSPAQLGR